MMNSAVLTTARLRPRHWRDEDLKPYAALNADLRVREFFPSVQTYKESADSMQFIRDHWQRRGVGLWAADVIGGAPFIGFIGLSVPSFDAPFMPCVGLGYRLAFEYWGHGSIEPTRHPTCARRLRSRAAGRSLHIGPRSTSFIPAP